MFVISQKQYHTIQTNYHNVCDFKKTVVKYFILHDCTDMNLKTITYNHDERCCDFKKQYQLSYTLFYIFRHKLENKWT